MAQYRYKAKVTDDIEDAREIIRNTGKMLQEGKIDKSSALNNLANAIKKLDSAKYYVDREWKNPQKVLQLQKVTKKCNVNIAKTYANELMKKLQQLHVVYAHPS